MADRAGDTGRLSKTFRVAPDLQFKTLPMLAVNMTIFLKT